MSSNPYEVDTDAVISANDAADRMIVAQNVALVKAAAADGSTAADMRAGFRAVLRLLKLLNAKVTE